MAAAWAVMHYLGNEGYARVTAAARAACRQLAAEITTIPQLALRAEPQATLLAFGAAEGSGLDVFAVADGLWRRGWYVDRQGPPPSLHCTVSNVHEDKIESFVGDLRAAIAEVDASAEAGLQGSYGTIE